MPKHKHNRRLLEMQEEIKSLQEEAIKFAKEGIDVDAINAALATLSTDVDALIAKGSGSISPAQAQTIADGLTALDAKIKAAIAA